MKTKVYVDGQHGTTGLEVNQYLERHPDIELLKIDFEDRRNDEIRKTYLNQADVVILCLPDEASIEAVGMITNDKTKVIDASTAYRTDDNWVYGIPELNKNQRKRIKTAKRVSNPGCHATASALLLGPLVQGGILDPNYPVSINSFTGYSGGGKALIETYEVSQPEFALYPRPYALTLTHKHLKEMKKHIGLSRFPLFTPILNNYYKGLTVTTTFNTADLTNVNGVADLVNYYKTFYQGEDFIHVYELEDGEGVLDGGFNVVGNINTNRADLFIFGNDEQVMLMCRIDNLGKGASGAAIQNLNIMIGSKEDTTLKN